MLAHRKSLLLLAPWESSEREGICGTLTLCCRKNERFRNIVGCCPCAGNHSVFSCRLTTTSTHHVHVTSHVGWR